jgi:nucleoside phosphorylase
MAEPIAFPYTHDDYNVGWVCALPKELATAIYMLEKRHPDLKQPRRDRSSYTLGRIGEHNIVIAGLPKAGAGNTKTSFATVAVRMINTFPNIKIPLMVGIGSGIPQKVRLGDVVISAPIDNWPGVVQWEIGKVEEADFVQTGSLNPPPRLLPLISLAEQSKLGVDMMAYLDKQIPQEYFLSPQSEDIAYKSSYQHIGGSDCGHCDDNMNNMAMARESQQKHRLHYGLIASGNQVIKSAALRDILYHQFNKSILCIDTEAAELENNFPCIIIRGISDYADSHTNMAWQEYAAAASAACAKAFLNIMPVSDVDKLQAVKSE